MKQAGQDLSPRCSTAVVKIASRCNLNCSYCYMYNMGDLTYAQQPKLMSRSVIDALLFRVAEHCSRHKHPRFTFAFHGGEPLLAPKDHFRYFVSRARSLLPPCSTATFSLQTNGVLLSPEWCGLFRELDIRLGISIDGPKSSNDRNRVDHRKDGTYARARRGWGFAKAHGLDPGILSVIDLQSPPQAIYAHLKELQPRKVDFLLPQGTYDKLPPGLNAGGSETPYADWLLEIFRLWVAEETPPFRIRLFDQIIETVMGTSGALDALGRGTNEVLTFETDGAIETVDVLRVCKSGITRTIFNVLTHSIDDAMDDEIIDRYHFSHARLCRICDGCPINEICGGGYLPHRYRSANGFDNPSIYCADLMKLIVTIRNHTLSWLPPAILATADVHPFSYAEARESLAGFQG